MHIVVKAVRELLCEFADSRRPPEAQTLVEKSRYVLELFHMGEGIRDKA